MRHGESVANIMGVVLSNPEDGKKTAYGLTHSGEEQVRQSVLEQKKSGALDENTLLITSPFSRTMRTAEIAKEILESIPAIQSDERLRERWFGNWEKTLHTAYANVWVEDKKNPTHTIENVESTSDVQERTMSLIHDLENQYTDKKILLVSHGDVLHILLTGLLKKSPADHRDIRHFETAEIRTCDL